MEASKDQNGLDNNVTFTIADEKEGEKEDEATDLPMSFSSHFSNVASAYLNYNTKSETNLSDASNYNSSVSLSTLASEDIKILPTIQVVERVADSDFSGFLDKKSLTGYWYPYWFSIKGAILRCYERRDKTSFRGIFIEEFNFFAATIQQHEDDTTTPRSFYFTITFRDPKSAILYFRTTEESCFVAWASAFTSARVCVPPSRSVIEMEGVNKDSIPKQIQKPPSFVLFVIHGIGTSEELFARNISSLQDTMKTIKEIIYPDVDFTFKVIPCRWRESLRSLAVDERMESLHPHLGESSVRDFLHDKGLDIMYYMTERYRNFILRGTVKKLNKLKEDFLDEFPNFEGQFSVLGHSLGGVIAYDILTKQTKDDPAMLAAENFKLNFTPNLLFLAGSPIGVFLNFEEDMMNQMCRPQPFTFFNIFHPYDPISYRCEPLFVRPEFLHQPITVPHYRTMDQRQSTMKWISSLLQRNTSITESSLEDGHEENHPPPPPPTPNKENLQENSETDQSKIKSHQIKNENDPEATVKPRTEKKWIPPPRYEIDPLNQMEIPADYRIDFVLQESAMEEVSTSAINALKGHGEYWRSSDMALFILAQWTFKFEYFKEAAVKYG